MSAERKVLLCLLGHSRPLDLPGSETSTAEIKRRVRELFADVLQLHPVADFFLQLKDANWNEFVDLAEQRIPDRAVLRAQVVEQVGWDCACSQLMCIFVCEIKVPHPSVSVACLMSRYSCTY